MNIVYITNKQTCKLQHIVTTPHEDFLDAIARAAEHYGIDTTDMLYDTEAEAETADYLFETVWCDDGEFTVIFERPQS